MKMKRIEYKKKRKKSSGKRLILKVSLLLTLSAIMLALAFGVSLWKKAERVASLAYDDEARAKSDLRDKKVEPLRDNVSILFIGVDDSKSRAQSDAGSRSDALIVATLNNKKKTVKLLSIPRDSRVYIPATGRLDRINHAYGKGGAQSTIETVEKLLDIPIDYYVKMNFDAFIDVVDALGGVEVEVPYERLEKDENDKYTIHLKPGLQRLDGQHALALARTRYVDNDIERGKRQQMILKAILKEAVSIKGVTKYHDVIEAVGDNMKTDMTFDEMTSLFDYVKGGMPKIDTLTLNGKDNDWDEGRPYYWLLDEEDLEEVKHILKAHLGLIPDSSSLSDNSSGSESAASSGK